MTKNIVTSIAIAALLIASTFAIAAPQDASGQTCTLPPSGLVSWWPGDGNANDIKDANHGTLVDSATFAAGNVGQAFSFDGVNDFVQVADSASLDITDGLTIDAWINLNAYTSGNQAIVSKLGGSTSERSYTLLITFTTGNIFFLTSSTGSGGAAIQGPAIPLNQWVHVAAVKDSGSASARIYVNGALAASGTVQHPIFSSTTPVGIGGIPFVQPGLPPAGDFFNGRIDEVEIYNSALTQSKIQAIFNAGSAGKCKPGADLHPPILSEVQKIEEKLDGDRPSLITAISNAITAIQNALSSIQTSIAQILGILQDPNFGLREIKKEVRNIESNVTSTEFGLKEIKQEVRNIRDTQGIQNGLLFKTGALVSRLQDRVNSTDFGLEEIKREVSSIEQKLDNLKVPIKVDIGVARLNDHRFAVLTTELGEQVDVNVTMVKAVKVKGGDDDDKKGLKIESKILTTSEFKVTKVQTGLFVLEILGKARSAADVIELKVEHKHSDGTVHLGAIIFDKEVQKNTNQ